MNSMRSFVLGVFAVATTSIAFGQAPVPVEPRQYLSGIVVYGLVNICQHVEEMTGVREQALVHAKFFSVINRLLHVVMDARGNAEKGQAILTSNDEELQKKREAQIQCLAQAIVLLDEIIVKRSSQPMVIESASNRENQQKMVVALLKSPLACVLLQQFFNNLVAYVQQELAAITHDIDAAMLSLTKEKQGVRFFGMITVPQLPLAGDMPEHEVTLLSAVIEGWNFFSTLMNHNDKQEYLKEQFTLLFEYLENQLQNLIQAVVANPGQVAQQLTTPGSSTAPSGSLVTINFHLL